MFSFNKKENCRQDAKETICLVMFGALLYAIFRMYYDYEDAVVPYCSTEEGDSHQVNFTVAAEKYFSSIFHLTASIKCLPAFFAIVQVYRMNIKARKQVKIRRRAANTYALLIIVGMILCAGGDYCLDIDTVKDDTVVREFLKALQLPVPPFIIGLVSFLLGHVAFILAFQSDGGNSWNSLHIIVLYLYAASIVFVILKHGNIQPEDNILKVGIVAYSIVIATMCRRSLSLALDAYPGLESTCYAVVGSIIFLVSDSLLAYNRFVSSIPFGRVMVLFTYFLSLAFIASSASGTTRWKVGWD